jgi:two-component system sensor histidine kinase/response regulator
LSVLNPLFYRNMFFRGFLLLTVVILNYPVYAQHTEKRHPKMVARIDSLNDHAYPLISQNAGKAFVMLTQAELLATEYNYTHGLAVAYLNQAEVLSQRGYYKRAIELYYRSLQLSKSTNDIYNIARAEEHISTIKRRSGGLTESENLLKHTLEVFTKLNKPVDVIDIQLRLGLIKSDQKKYSNAKYYYDKAYRLSKAIKNIHGEKKSYYNRALLYKALGKPDSAIFFLNKTLYIDSVTGDNYSKALSYIELSRVYVNKKQLSTALMYANLAYEKADSLAALALVKTAVQLLLHISKETVNKDDIIKWQEELIFLDATISERERKESVDFIDALRMQEEQQVKIQKNVIQTKKKSEQQKSLIILYTGFLLVFVIIVFTLAYNYKKAQKYTDQLNVKNKQIEQNMLLLDRLNSEIISQNQKLEDDNRLKSKLLSIISHDLRKPLASTQSLVHLVHMGLISKEETKDLFGRLEAQYTMVLALTDNLLFWIRGQVSGGQVELAKVHPYDLVNNITQEQKIPITDKSILIKNFIPHELQWLTDIETLKIVIRNLLNNAIKFTPINGCIEFSAGTDDTYTSLTITDNGIGMSQEAIDNINTESYYTTKGTQNEEGSGFGIMLIRDLIKKYNGRLRITSKPGNGSAFTISFPVAKTLAS